MIWYEGQLNDPSRFWFVLSRRNEYYEFKLFQK